MGQQERGGGNQGDKPLSTAVIITHGFEHLPLNLQAVTSISTTIRRAFTGGRKEGILFIERAGPTYERAETFAREVDRYGGLWNANYREIIVRRFGSKKADELMEQYRRTLSLSDGETIIENALVPTPLNHYLYREIDLLRAEYGFQLKVEGHSKEVLRRMDIEEKKAHNAEQNGHDALLRGDFASAVRWEEKRARSLLVDCQLKSGRERELAKDFGDWISALLQNPEGGVLVGVVGYNHAISLFPPLKAVFGDRIQSIAESSVPQNYVWLLINQRVRSGEQAEPVLYARSIFMSLAQGFVQWYYGNSHHLYAYGLHYETILNELSRLTNSMSYQELERVCLDRDSFTTLLKGSLP